MRLSVLLLVAVVLLLGTAGIVASQGTIPPVFGFGVTKAPVKVGERFALVWQRESQTGKGVEFTARIPAGLVFPGTQGGCEKGVGCTYRNRFADNPPGRESVYLRGYASRPGRYEVATTFVEVASGYTEVLTATLGARSVFYFPIIRRN